MKEQCTRNKDGRRITRWIDEHILERLAERLKANPASRPERKPIVGHPFGTLKHANDQGSCLMAGLMHARAEFSLSCVEDNLKRVLNILGVPQLLGALRSGGRRRDVGRRSSTGRSLINDAYSELPRGNSRPDPIAPQVSVSVHTVWRLVRP